MYLFCNVLLCTFKRYIHLLQLLLIVDLGFRMLWKSVHFWKWNSWEFVKKVSINLWCRQLYLTAWRSLLMLIDLNSWFLKSHLLCPAPRWCTSDVCLSVTLVDCIHTAEDIVKHLSPPGNPIILFFWALAQVLNSKGKHLQRGHKIHWRW